MHFALAVGRAQIARRRTGWRLGAVAAASMQQATHSDSADGQLGRADKRMLDTSSLTGPRQGSPRVEEHATMPGRFFLPTVQAGVALFSARFCCRALCRRLSCPLLLAKCAHTHPLHVGTKLREPIQHQQQARGALPVHITCPLHCTRSESER
ncbi:hypothetical protein EJ06DRAFT_528472 [Trichodelitschia bisporula]|uniref:Uncharacterized protein n=1 Tax=Trichodelitschia bisporula TaxID=703511 RepID=A0A6G1I280_9PEZI|nr:hypothetical protein EJ06DRAFT_528472 [Trichodelitschia bisporula]